MDYQTACQVLGVNPGETEPQIKKKHKKLAAQYHPDINKDPSAEAKGKEVNEAFDFLKKNNFKEPEPQIVDPFAAFRVNIQDFFGNHSEFIIAKSRQLQRDVCLDEILENLRYQVDYERDLRCIACLKDEQECSVCNNTRLVKKPGRLTIGLQPFVGVTRHKKQGGGSCYLYTSPKGVKHWVMEDLVVDVNITPSKRGFSVEDGRLQRTVEIPLLMALQGGKVQVETLHKKLTVKIPAGTKHGQVLALNGEGPNYLAADPYNTKGTFALRVEVAYPEVTAELLAALEPKKPGEPEANAENK